MDSNPYIHLYSGKKFHFLNPSLDEIDIECIAHGLSQINRWTGQTRRPLSVAEHAVNCCDMAPAKYKFDSLMHDSGENFGNDVAKPIKNFLKDYLTIEAGIEKVVAEKYNLEYPMNPIVKIIDNCMMVTEGLQLIKNFEKDKYEYTPFDIKIKCWSPRRAKKEFLKRYYQLRPEEKGKTFWNKLFQKIFTP